MSHALKNVYSFVGCCSILGIALICCLQTEGFSHAVQWPSGKYGLPMAESGCPKANGFLWDTGYLYQDLEVNTIKSSSFHLNARIMSLGDVSRRFCMKTNKSSDTGRPDWPYGNYCIYKKGSNCPKGLLDGWVLWDDDNSKGGMNLNFKYGSVPNGNYGQDTKIFFCCQIMGSTDDPIQLPIDTPFYLIAWFNKKCQEVSKTIHTIEFIRYDTETDNNHNKQSIPYPYGADSYPPYIYYCYYKACRWTKTSLQDTFWSPNYPSGYKNKAWCEWYINVPQKYIISLKFDDFHLESTHGCATASCNCDYVEVRETLSNGTSALIGKYCMGASYPYGDIKSHGNNMTVLFWSDYMTGAPGFKARYQAIQVTAPTSVISTTKRTTVPFTARTTITSSTGANNTSTSYYSSTISDKWTIPTVPSTTPTKHPSQGTNSSSKSPTSKATTLFTNQNTTSSFATDELTTTRATEPEKETTGITSEKDVSSTEPNRGTERTDNATIEPSVHEAKNEKKGTGNAYTIVVVVTAASLIVIAGVVVLSIIVFWRKRKLKNVVERDRLTVSFTAAEKTHGISNVIPNMYTADSEENEEDECYTHITKLQNVDNLYKNRAFTDSTDQFIADDELIKKSDNPLYSNSEENEEKDERYTNITKLQNVDILYENSRPCTDSNDQFIEDYEIKKSDNPLYSSSEENEEKDERYTNITKLQNVDILYENRAFTDYTDPFMEDEREIKESDNPLYSSSVETVQDNNNVLYESMDELSQCIIESESDNPVYEGMV